MNDKNEKTNLVNTIKNYADRLIGDDGVQFTVEANLAPSNYMYIGFAIAGGMIVGSLITIMMKKITKTN